MKPFWKSKTLWANLAVIGLQVGNTLGYRVPSPEVELVAFMNLLLRVMTTRGVGLK